VPYLSASAVVIHYEGSLYQVYAPLPLPLPCPYGEVVNFSYLTSQRHSTEVATSHRSRCRWRTKYTHCYWCLCCCCCCWCSWKTAASAAAVLRTRDDALPDDATSSAACTQPLSVSYRPPRMFASVAACITRTDSNEKSAQRDANTARWL